MPEMRHISSAALRVTPERMAAVEAAVAEIEGCEVALAQDGRIVVLIEAESSNAVGARLGALSLVEGVHSALMVYEQVELADALDQPHVGENA
jgi:periplasmic nitrate reductase NapD